MTTECIKIFFEILKYYTKKELLIILSKTTVSVVFNMRGYNFQVLNTSEQEKKI